jgi:hypothetical protein
MHGFSPEGALHAWECISAIAVGTAAADIREASARGTGQPWIARMHAELARHRADELTAIRSLLAHGYIPDAESDFERRLDVALAGIAALDATTRDERH